MAPHSHIGNISILFSVLTYIPRAWCLHVVLRDRNRRRRKVMVQIDLFSPQQYSFSEAEGTKKQDFNNPTLRMSQVRDPYEEFPSPFYKDQNVSFIEIKITYIINYS